MVSADRTVGDSSVSCVRGDDLEVWYFPSKLPELNAVEGCWDQLQEWFKYRLVPDISSLKDYISRGVNAISEPSVWPDVPVKIRPKHYKTTRIESLRRVFSGTNYFEDTLSHLLIPI